MLVSGTYIGEGATGADEELIEAVRDAAADIARVGAGGQVRDASLVRAQWEQLCRGGWLGLLAAEARGGAGLSPAVMAAFYEALGAGGVTANFAQPAVLALAAIEACEPTAAGNRLIEALVAGTACPLLCWQTRSEEDEQELAFVEITGGGDRLTVQAERLFVDLIELGTHFCLPARIAGRAGLLVVPRDDASLSLLAVPGLSGEPLGELRLEGPVGQGAFLPLAAPDGLLRAFALARIAVAAQLAGLLDQIIHVTTEYLVQRVQFGKAIASNQVVQHRRVDLWGQKGVTRASVAHACAMISAGAEDAFVAALAAKARAGEAAARVVKEAFQLHGAIGYTGEYQLGSLARGCLSLAPWLGSPKALRRRFVQHELVLEAAA